MDRRTLREQNFAKNQSDPISESEPQGGVGNRDRNTGDRRTKLDNQGTYRAKPLFDSSPGQNTDVQLNQRTGTADYRSVSGRFGDLQGLDIVAQAATGVPNPDPVITEIAEPNPDNSDFGNCGACNGLSKHLVDCPSGFVDITFGDGETFRAETPAEIVYEVKVTFDYITGGSGSIKVNACGDIEFLEDEDDPSPAIAGYGTLIYQANATSVTVEGSTRGNLKSFQVYNNACSNTVIGVQPDGDRVFVGIMPCDMSEFTYTPPSPSNCIRLGGQKVCNIDPESIQRLCVVSVYELCRLYRVTWTLASTGQIKVEESCDPIGWEIVPEPQDRAYRPGARPVGTGLLRYDSGVPRKFTVHADGTTYSSGDYGYFQIYQSVENGCEYDIVGVQVTFQGATTIKDYQTIRTGDCDFEIQLGDYLGEGFLRIYDDKGNIIIETGDFVPGSVVGCVYVGEINGVPDFRSQNNTNLACFPTAEFERVLVKEKTANANIIDGVTVEAIECVV